MSTFIAPAKRAAGTSGYKPNLLDRTARAAVLARLSGLEHGQLTVEESGEKRIFGGRETSFPLRAVLQVHDPRFYRFAAFGGSIGAAEAYMLGYWSAEDLTAVMRIFVLNRAVLDGMERGLALLTAPLQKFFHRFNENTKEGSLRNISAHYDLGNDFYSLFLDETMMYSCAIFEREDSTLHEASVAKIDRICRKLALSPDDHLVEIGTGWGGLAVHAARHFGCRVTTTTISKRQYELAQERVRQAGLGTRIEVLFRDYRDLRGRYDKLVSVEMIEAVGHKYYDDYFRCCSGLLKPEGMMLLQAIVISDQHYEQARRSVDFIQRYIFPGSCIPSIGAISNSITRATDLRLFHLEDITVHYATTLRTWRERFFANIEQVRAQGHSEEFIRMWEFYLCYCEGGFLERFIGDVQMVFTKPFCRREPILARL